ncbi:hypothetical protein Cadr_000002036 [Camelus dromedarius]|uniref:Uncharacterized protein n=1 Tax=Camelus dromedarius TaxID=9838 RepID=A0A5N4EGP4_CAMDR|nr:hypothetical protein Cadr_000002036 [Camelus dromedarius]
MVTLCHFLAVCWRSHGVREPQAKTTLRRATGASEHAVWVFLLCWANSVGCLGLVGPYPSLVGCQDLPFAEAADCKTSWVPGLVLAHWWAESGQVLRLVLVYWQAELSPRVWLLGPRIPELVPDCWCGGGAGVQDVPKLVLVGMASPGPGPGWLILCGTVHFLDLVLAVHSCHPTASIQLVPGYSWTRGLCRFPGRRSQCLLTARHFGSGSLLMGRTVSPSSRLSGLRLPSP